jgi:hypothetical protein
MEGLEPPAAALSMKTFDLCNSPIGIALLARRLNIGIVDEVYSKHGLISSA